MVAPLSAYVVAVGAVLLSGISALALFYTVEHLDSQRVHPGGEKGPSDVTLPSNSLRH
jgi:hypothetical protein